MREVGFAIVGCGVIAPTHARGIAAAEGARLVACCDVIEEKARALAEEYSCEAVLDWRDLLARPDIDVLCITTPSGMHAQMAIAAAQAGKHALVEKPMAITLADCHAMIEAHRKAGTRLGVIFQRRAVEPFLSVREAVRNGSLGRLVLADMYAKYYRSQAYYDSADWRGTWELDGGGCLMNQGIHIVDQLLFLTGSRVEEVCARTATLARRIKVEDVAVAAVRYENGAYGVIEGATAVFPPTIPHRIELHGTDGSIVIEGEAVVRYEVRGAGEEVVNMLAGAASGEARPIRHPTDISPKGHFVQIQDMVHAVKEGRDPIVSGEDALPAVAVVLAIYESAREGRPVKVRY